MRRLLLLWALTACGDPLVEDGYRGVPLLTFEGRVSDFRSQEPINQLSASIFWSETGESTTETELLIEQTGISVKTTFPARFEISIFHPPGADVVEAVPRPYLVALLLVYEDVDGDGRMGPDELRGGASDGAVLYAPTRLSAEDSPTGRVLEAGYHVTRLPLFCDSPAIPIQRGDQACGTRLGARCTSHADCGGPGICRTDVVGGYCVIPFTDDGCHPEDGVRGPSLTNTPPPTVSADDWLRACDVDADCRVEEGYTCPFWLGACYPLGPLEIRLGPRLDVAPVCP